METLSKLGYEIIRGDSEEYLPGDTKALRADYKEVVLIDRLTRAVNKINKDVPADAREQAVKLAVRSSSQKLIEDNEAFHKMLVDGIDVPVRAEGGIRHKKVWLFDFEHPENNEFLAVNQFTVVEGSRERRPDIVLFVNGLPLVVIELKNAADEQATIQKAYNQFQTYMEELPYFFRFNEILITSDGNQARAGTITSKPERFMQWKTVDGEKPRAGSETEILLKGMLEKHRLLDIVRNFIVFEKDKETSKKLAAYHQYWAANKAFNDTIKARKGNKKAGIVWHTQGSGKSLTMIFYVGKLVRELDNPTVVVLTDRNDLDDQLFGTFGRCTGMLRQDPTQAESRKKLQELLNVASGGIVFTTIQKFSPEEDTEKYPTLSKRDNIFVIADEAHRSQYGFSAKVLNKKDKTLITYGYAKYLRDALPNASFIGFTGTPIEKADKSTPAVFGDYVDIYDIEQAVKDGSTVTIYYESRLAKLELKPEERLKIDPEFEEVTEGEEVDGREKLKRKWAAMEKVVGSPKRLRRIAKDIVNHYEKRASVLEGKAMIVCMSRRVCVDLYNEIIKLKPEWHNEDDEKGFIKVIMTGSASDGKEWQPHIRNKKRRKKISDNFRDETNNEPKIIIVRDMLLTGFDVPCLHTMYLDKPMRGHTLMQAIARVNRVFKDKQGGLIVDYMGVGVELRTALIDYTESGGKGKPISDQEKAVELMLEKYTIVKDMFHGFDYKKFFDLSPKDRVPFIPKAMEHILKEKGKKERFLREAAALLRVFSLSVPHDRAMSIKEEVGLFQAIRSILAKTTGTKITESIIGHDSAIRQILSKSVVSDRVVDIFEAAGIKKPDMTILSEGFLAEVKDMPQKNLAFEALKKLLNDEIRIISRRNIIQGKSFMDLLDRTIKRYTNRSVEAAQVIEELVQLARQVREEKNRGKVLEMSNDEVAFYDALYANDSAVKVLGDEILRKIALELTFTIRKSVTIDWTVRESVQAAIRLKVRKILRKYEYPPDMEKMATDTVLKQAELLAENWVTE